jgi:hypothetical protein
MINLPQIIVELIPDPEYGGYTACIPGVQVFGEGATEKLAIDDLKIALGGYIAQYSLEDVLSKMILPTQLKQMNFSELVHG